VAEAATEEVPDLAEVGPDALSELLKPHRRTAVVDIGANPVDGDRPYAPMLRAGLCTVVGFEPQAEALARLRQIAGPDETYLPWAVGDGGTHTLYICAAEGMTSLLRPDPKALERFHLFDQFGAVVSTVELPTRRLDDIAEVPAIDLLKIDIQGSELMVFRNGRQALRDCVAIHTEVSFLPLYEGQPTFGEVDVELRAAGFVPHGFAAVKNWALTPLVREGNPRIPFHQLLEADAVYVRDVAPPTTEEQLKHLALLSHHVYGSVDLAARCVRELRDRGAAAPDAVETYCALLVAAGRDVSLASPGT
jgi:FkbM family methyltransferase